MMLSNMRRLSRYSTMQLSIRTYVMPTFEASGKEKIAIIGSGSFGSACARIVGENAARYGFTEKTVHMYTFEEDVIVGDGSL